MGRLSMGVACLLALSSCSGDEKSGALAVRGAGSDRAAEAEKEPDVLAQAVEPVSLGLAPLSRERLMDPQTCAGCHPKHYREWAQSMHAYAGEDPVFIAMNKRGQRMTNGALGDFCVKCHAPLARAEGLTVDGLNLAELPKKMRGVTCYFCHNAVEVGPDHFNNPIKLANDNVMRGGIRNPVSPGVHGVAYSDDFNRNSMKSSVMCGSCHDIVNPKGTHIERTFEEYKQSIFSFSRSTRAQGGDSCSGCHMRASFEEEFVSTLSDPRLPKRVLHDHAFAAVDVALTDDFPDKELFRLKTACELSQTGLKVFQVQTDGRGFFSLRLESDAGHAQPSGASQDRRMWVEFIAKNAQGAVVFQSGVIADGEREEWPVGHPKHDRNLFMLRDHFYDDNGVETHNFWDAARTDGKTIPVMIERRLPHYRDANFQIPSRQQPARVEFRVKMRPVGIDVLEDLVETGDLDPAVVKRMPTFTLYQTDLVWTPDKGNLWIEPFKDKGGRPPECEAVEAAEAAEAADAAAED